MQNNLIWGNLFRKGSRIDARIYLYVSVQPMRKRSYPNLELEEDIVFERKNWKAERIAWVVLTLFVLAALIGLFGRGGISKAKAGSVSGGIEVEYERFLRYHTADKLSLLVHNTGKNGAYSLTLNQEWLNKMQVKSIHPAPEKETATASGIQYTFQVAANGQPIQFTFYFEPQEMGNAHCTLSDDSGNQLSFSQFIYP